MVRGRRKVRVGRVVSDRMDKTVVVAVEWRQMHRLYGKSVKRITKFHAHDEENVCKMGDMVNIMETRPLSRTKRWRVTSVITAGDAAVGVKVQDMPEMEPDAADDQAVEAVVETEAAVAVETAAVETEEAAVEAATDEAPEAATAVEAADEAPETAVVAEAATDEAPEAAVEIEAAAEVEAADEPAPADAEPVSETEQEARP